MKPVLMAVAVVVAMLGTAVPVLAESDLQAVKRMIAKRLPNSNPIWIGSTAVMSSTFQRTVDICSTAH